MSELRKRVLELRKELARLEEALRREDDAQWQVFRREREEAIRQAETNVRQLCAPPRS